MGANIFGDIFKCCSFGESHGPAVGAVIDGCPAGAEFSLDLLRKELGRRRPGRNEWSSARSEPDEPEVLSGVFQGKTLGSPIAVIVRNKDARPEEYEKIRSAPRPGHADDLWQKKFGERDYRGGGRSSGRETVARVIAGSIARMALKSLCPDFHAMAFVRRLAALPATGAKFAGSESGLPASGGPAGGGFAAGGARAEGGPTDRPLQKGGFKPAALCLEESELREAEGLFKSRSSPDSYPACFPHKEKSQEAEKLLKTAKARGESLGALVELWAEGLPAGLGQPVFRKFKADLAAALLGIGATSGLSIGAGEEAAFASGSEFHHGQTKHYGGLRGGLTTGERLRIQIPFKPPASFGATAREGRHDPCIAPRAVPVVEAMLSMTALNHLLWKRLDRL